jgi:6-phosphogluconolactonase
VEPDVRVFPDKQEINRAAAAEFVARALEAVGRSGSFTVALAGGSTPKSVYTLLGDNPESQRLPWGKMQFFFGDERHVPPTHPDSNYRMAEESLFCKVPVNEDQLFRVKGENPDADQAAAEYERTLRDCFQLSDGQLPRFDLILLGMGPDGHTASLFPGTQALRQTQRLVVANWVEKFKTHRITFTAPVINNAACVIFMVSGEEKREALRAVLHGDAPAEQFPAKLVHPTQGELIWLVDEAAYPDAANQQQKRA